MRSASRLAVIAGVLLVATAAPATQSAPVAGLQIYASVTTLTGRPVTELKATDFEVLVDGKPRKIVDLSVGPNALRIAVVADTSGSMWLPGELENILAQFPIGMKLMDQSCFIGFGPGLDRKTPFSRDPTEVVRAAKLAWESRRPLEGPSPLWDALDLAISELERQEGRRLLIVMTDGRATGNTVAFDAVLRRAVAANVEISALISGLPPRDREPPRAALLFPWERPRQLVDLTGGTLVGGDARDGAPARAWLTALTDAARGAYRLAIEPGTADTRIHTVEVRVPKPGLLIRARRLLVTP